MAPAKRKSTDSITVGSRKSSRNQSKTLDEAPEPAGLLVSPKAKDDTVVPYAPSKPKKLAIGDELPHLTLKNEDDESIDLGALKFDKGVVIFSYPKASTPGCTSQGKAVIHIETRI